MQNSQNSLQSAIDNIHADLIDCNKKIISCLAKKNGFLDEAIKWVRYANLIKNLTPEYAIPTWLIDACNEFGDVYRGDQHAVKIANFAVENALNIYQPILLEEVAFVDVEEIFRTQAQRLSLNDSFEKLISLLSEIIAADVIEHRTVDEALRRLQALFHRTKHGSLASILMTMNFGRFVINSFGDVLRANKYAKPFIENFEKEFADASEVVEKAENAMQKEVVAKLTNANRIQLFIESNPSVEPVITGFLPPSQSNSEAEN